MDRLVVQQSGGFTKLDLGDPTGPKAWRNFCAVTDFDASEVSNLPSSWWLKVSTHLKNMRKSTRIVFLQIEMKIKDV